MKLAIFLFLIAVSSASNLTEANASLTTVTTNITAEESVKFNLSDIDIDFTSPMTTFIIAMILIALLMMTKKKKR